MWDGHIVVVILGKYSTQANENQKYHEVPHAYYWHVHCWRYCHCTPIKQVLLYGCQQNRFSMIPQISPHYLPIQSLSQIHLLSIRCSSASVNRAFKSECLVFNLHQVQRTFNSTSPQDPQHMWTVYYIFWGDGVSQVGSQKYCCSTN